MTRQPSKYKSYEVLSQLEFRNESPVHSAILWKCPVDFEDVQLVANVNYMAKVLANISSIRKNEVSK